MNDRNENSHFEQNLLPQENKNNSKDTESGSAIEKTVSENQLQAKKIGSFKFFWENYQIDISEKWEAKNIVEKFSYLLEYPFNLLM